ncbi:2-oxoglutarate-dependent dioxygenase DAO-like [Olea europaea subsp. europaea]|uniref:2-oxoglutarate-dependent dioxygenase DAO-like n=1 Tax=Olea europaea subsp. europaea TaxID=158383 RepID=A0A8S0RYE5_OLEEU|nr:2-oxoglutarate-dependent dioxygenase DAO-like [Olea europaea subsp. europaea]
MTTPVITEVKPSDGTLLCFILRTMIPKRTNRIHLLLKAFMCSCWVWSSGRFCSVKHRVQCYKPKIRTSIALFVLVPSDGNVEASPQLVDVNHPRLYVPFHFEDYRKIRSSTKSLTGAALELLRTKRLEPNTGKKGLLYI